MTTDAHPIAIPSQLEDWRPACDLFDHSDSHAADYALVWHNRCDIYLTCERCLAAFRGKMDCFLSDWSPETHDLICDGCNTQVSDPYGCIHLEPL